MHRWLFVGLALMAAVGGIGTALVSGQRVKNPALGLELIAMSEPGDIVLITGKGERSHQVLANTVVPFSDREIAAEFLQNFVKPVTRSRVEAALCAA